MYRLTLCIFLNLLPILISTSVNATEQIQGVSIHANKYNKSADDILSLIEESGFNSVRQDLTWNDIESVKGKYEIPEKLKVKDLIIQNSMKYNISPLVILNYGNKNYNNGGYPTSDNDIKAFANYSKWVATRYKGKVHYYEIWNEWTVGTGMKGKGEIPSEDVYLKLVKETSEAIRSIDPEAKLLAGSINPLSPTGRRLEISDTVWFKQLISKGILKYIDGISVHPYSFLNADKSLRNPEYNLEKIENFYKSISSDNNKNIPIYITEVGVPTHTGQGGVNQSEAADFVVKYSLLARTKNYIKGVWWYDLRDDGTDDSNQEHNFGFYNNNFQPKQAALAFANLHNALKNMKILGVSSEDNKNNKEILISLESLGDSKKHTINWKERQLKQNGRLKILSLQRDGSSPALIYDNNKLSQDVFLTQ